MTGRVGSTHGLLSDNSRVGGSKLHGLLLLWRADFGHLGRLRG
jgi:hypothetical protein